jgi:cytochrome P450
MIAGRDTTACALAWAFFELAKAPACQQRLRDEWTVAMGPDGDAVT